MNGADGPIGLKPLPGVNARVRRTPTAPLSTGPVHTTAAARGEASTNTHVCLSSECQGPNNKSTCMLWGQVRISIGRFTTLRPHPCLAGSNCPQWHSASSCHQHAECTACRRGWHGVRHDEWHRRQNGSCHPACVHGAAAQAAGRVATGTTGRGSASPWQLLRKPVQFLLDTLIQKACSCM